MTLPSTFVIIATCTSLVLGSYAVARSIREEVPLLHSKIHGFTKELGKANFDDIDMEERYVFKDQNDLLEYITELQRRYALLVGRPRFGRSVRSNPRTSDDYLF